MSKANKPLVSIVMGSDSDWPLMEAAVKTLREFTIPCETRVLSAHRVPAKAARYSKSAARRGIKVLIAAAGGAAHLAGLIAANSTLPIIGVPVKGGVLDGLDALLSTVQMPAGVPVATVALGPAGAVNAALLAVQILALNDKALAKKIVQHKQRLMAKVAVADRKVRSLAEQGPEAPAVVTPRQTMAGRRRDPTGAQKRWRTSRGTK